VLSYLDTPSNNYISRYTSPFRGLYCLHRPPSSFYIADHQCTVLYNLVMSISSLSLPMSMCVVFLYIILSIDPSQRLNEQAAAQQKQQSERIASERIASESGDQFLAQPKTPRNLTFRYIPLHPRLLILLHTLQDV